MAEDNSQRSTGSEDTLGSNRVQKNTERLSDAAHLEMGTWNCGGLSKVKKDMCVNLDLDITCLTETHSWRDNNPGTIYSDSPGKNDPWSGVALLLNKRVSKYVISSGRVGSRIVHCRLRGSTCNIFIIGVYIPQKNRTRPNQNDTYDKLESLLYNISNRDCIILMGDFNSRLSRYIPGRVGPWCIHKDRDSGGDRLLHIMNTLSLRCVSTYFQPPPANTTIQHLRIFNQKKPPARSIMFWSAPGGHHL